MTTEARLRANLEFHAKRKREGWRKVTVWLSPESAAKVDALKKAAGSADEVHRKAILAWAGPGAPPMVPDVQKKARAKPSKAVETLPHPTAGAVKAVASASRKAASKASNQVQFGPTKRAPGSMQIDKRKGRAPKA